MRKKRFNALVAAVRKFTTVVLRIPMRVSTNDTSVPIVENGVSSQPIDYPLLNVKSSEEQFPSSLTASEIADDPRNDAMRFNAGKPQMSYPLSTGVALHGVARVMEFGALKYERDNWKKGLNPDSILDSMGRHISAYLDGEYIDTDSGLPHIDHIACNALFLGYHTNRETGDGKL